MDELYSNLENYNEVATLEELKSENMELKTKLQNYASAMDKLQKDFDTLSSEFKKLEHNYSSLLKTAKSEIERKTQIITNINMEKDMLILTALKKGDKSVLQMKKNIPNYNKNKRKQNDGAGKCVKKAKEVQDTQNKKCDSENRRLQEHQAPINNRVNNIGRENIQKQKILNRISPKTDSCNHGHTKENIQHIHVTPTAQHENIVQPIPSKMMHIKNRRKSTLTADDECERLTLSEKVDYLAVDGSQDVHTRNKEDRKSLFKYDLDRNSKSSETSSRDERILGYCEPSSSSKNVYKGRTHKHYDSDKPKNQDKYDMSQKFKRHSPERYMKHPRYYYEDYNHRSDFSRIRDSPPVDRFHHPSYKEQIDHERFKYNEHERYGKEKYTSKHKIQHEYEDPYTKRQKTDYYGRQKDDVRWHGEEILEHQELTETFEMLQKQYTSCQSPDYTYSEIASEPIKVIMDTAETPLEDPRLATSKYILSNDNGSVSLSTAKGRHVHLEPIDKTRWQLQNVLIPNALIKPPTEEQLIKDLYMDTDVTQSKLSIESEAASTDSQVVPNKQFTKDKQAVNVHDTYGDITEKISSSEKMIENLGKPTQGCLTSYKIPKIRKCDQNIKINAFVEERSLEVIEDLCTDNNDKNDKQNLNSDSNRLPLENFEKHGNICYNVIRSDKKNCAVLQNSSDVHANHKVLSTREIVEGDLELSDETCDVDLQKIVKHSIHEENVNSHYKTNIICPTNRIESSTFSSLKNSKIEQSESSKDNLLVEVDKSLPHDINEEHNEVNKKQKNKKKTYKYRELEHIDVNDKKLKLRRDKKENPKEVKSKFNDLFGDSNSLITPDDLGISSSQVQTASQLAGIYLPIFEDAQDATDLKQTTSIQTSSVPKTKTIAEVDTFIGNEKKMESNCKIDEISKVVPELRNYETTKVSHETDTVIKTINDTLKLENCNKENDIVTTIIISTGVQPDKMNTESKAESLVNADELLSEEIEQDHIDVTQKHQDVLIKALATSTPHKQMVHQIPLEIDSKLSNSSYSSKIIINPVNDETCVPNTNNASELPTEDLPDIRIFVKRRRRRVVKSAK